MPDTAAVLPPARHPCRSVLPPDLMSLPLHAAGLCIAHALGSYVGYDEASDGM